MKFFMKDFFRKCDQIRRKLRVPGFTSILQDYGKKTRIHMIEFNVGIPRQPSLQFQKQEIL